MADLSQVGAFISQTLGGGATGALQAGSAFTAEVTSLQSTLDSKFASLGSVLGTFGLAGALRSASGAATAASANQESALISSLKAQWVYLVPLALIGAWLWWRSK